MSDLNINKLPRNPMRREDEPGYEKEIWQPDWKCFCCHDTGIIYDSLAALVIDGYDSDHDKFPRCVNPGCNAGSDWDSEILTDCVDYRISALTCQKLDAIERENWRRTIESQFEAIHNSVKDTVKDTARGMSFKRVKRDRTPSEEEIAKKRHESALNADPQKLRSLAQAYLGDEFMRDGAS